MHRCKHFSSAFVFALALAACGDDGSDDGGTGTNPTTSTAPTTTAPTTGDPTGDPTGSPTGDPTSNPTGDPTSDPSGDPTSNPTGDPTGDPTTTTDPTTGGGDFVFDMTPPESMVQLDRAGMPAVAIMMISEDKRDAYNDSDPAFDAEGAFVSDIAENLAAMHDALDDDLLAQMFVPCAAMNCVEQVLPLVIPDTLLIDIGMPAGFPNGRRLEDPVIDVLLALLLLDLSVPGQTSTSLIGLNPEKNDAEFLPDFPYLAVPH